MTDTNERFSQTWQLYGYAILDVRGTPMGPVTRVWTDNATGALKFLGLRTSRFARATHVVPASDVPVDETTRSIRVPYTAERIRVAPSYNTDVPLTDQREGDVAAFYGQS